MNEILLNDEIGYWGISSQSIISQLSEMKGDVTVKISSPGGEVFQGIEIFNALKDYDKGQIHIIITSLAASMASYIALAGDTIKVYDNAVFMIHNAWSGVWGDHRDMRKSADILEGLSSLLAKKYISTTGKSKDEVHSMMDEETYLYGDEILLHGFCDEVISTNDDVDKNEAVAFSKEKFKSCSKNMTDNFNKDEFVQSAAKLNKDGIFAKVQDIDVTKDEVLKNKVADDAKQQQRDLQIALLEREVI